MRHLTVEEDKAITVTLASGELLPLHIDSTMLDMSYQGKIVKVSVVTDLGIPCDGDITFSRGDIRLTSPWNKGWEEMFIASPEQYSLKVHHDRYKDVNQQVIVEPLPSGAQQHLNIQEILIRSKPVASKNPSL